MYTQVCTYSYFEVCTYIYKPLYKYRYICIYTYVYIYIRYTHKYIYTFMLYPVWHWHIAHARTHTHTLPLSRPHPEFWRCDGWRAWRNSMKKKRARKSRNCAQRLVWWRLVPDNVYACIEIFFCTHSINFFLDWYVFFAESWFLMSYVYV